MLWSTRPLSKKLLGKFNNHVSNNHWRWSDEFQIQNLRKAVTLAATIKDYTIYLHGNK